MNVSGEEYWNVLTAKLTSINDRLHSGDCDPYVTQLGDELCSLLWEKSKDVGMTPREHAPLDLTALSPAVLDVLCEAYEVPVRWRKHTSSTVAAVVKEMQQFEAPLLAEFDRRGGWSRYFRVFAQHGHIHRALSCSSLWERTLYEWLTELAGQSLEAVISLYGTRICAVCFPEASTLPQWASAQSREASALKARLSLYCPGSGRETHSKELRVTCEVCGRVYARTARGTVRVHNAK